MKRMLSLTLGLLLLAATNVLAQETTSSSQDIGNVPSSLTAESAVKTYTVSQAYPIAKNLINQSIALTGVVGKSLSMPIGVWIYLTEGTTKISIVKKFTSTVTTSLTGKQVKVFGAFGYNAQKQFVFNATGLKVLDNTTSNTSTPVR